MYTLFQTCRLSQNKWLDEHKIVRFIDILWGRSLQNKAWDLHQCPQASTGLSPRRIDEAKSIMMALFDESGHRGQAEANPIL